MTTELTVQDKKELTDVEKATRPLKVYSPDVDIYEDKECLYLVADIPGVKSEDVDIQLEKRVLTISAQVNVDEYEGMKALYGEYKVGDYYRQFTLGDDIDQDKIEAKVTDGVLSLLLPKMESAVARKIKIN
jgi:HSP20 family protein